MLTAALTLVVGPTIAHAAPSGSVAFDGYETAGAVPSGLRVKIGVDDAGGTPPLLRRLQLDLPAGFDFGAQVGSRPGGLALCTPAQFAIGAAGPSNCPGGSQVGTARLDSPEVGTPLTGRLYLGTPAAAGGLPGLDLEVSAGGSDAPGAVRAKLAGAISGDPAGRLHVTFDQIPQPAFRTLELTFDGGPTAPLITPGACGAAAGLVTFTAANDDSVGSAAGATTIGPDCASGQISGSLALSSDDRTAGAESTIRGALSLPDRGPAVAAASVHLPSGLLAHIGEVPECPIDVAQSGQCGADTRIGSISVVSGAGPQPATFDGSLFIVPRGPGAVAGMVAVLDVRIGELDLGRLVLPGQFALRPGDAGLDLDLTAPATFNGIALHLRAVSLAVDRPSFALNPSTCGPLPYSGVIGAHGGSSSAVGGTITYDGCGARPFAPTLTASLGGEIAPLGHPSVTVGLNARAGDSNLLGAVVTLPRGIAADPANIQVGCPERVFQAAACSATARVGTATARVALTPEPIPGDVYLVKIDGQQLPGLGLSFTGRYTQRVLSSVRVTGDGRLAVRFDAIPDLPLRRLDLTITGGPQGPIRVAGGKCTDGAVWDASFRGQGGQASSHTIPAPCPPRAAKRAAVSLSSTRGLSVRMSDLGGRSLNSLKVTLPAGYSINRSRAGNRRFRSLALNSGTATIKATNRTVQVFPTSKTATKVTLKLGQGTIRRVASMKGSRSVVVDVRIAFTDGSVQRQRIRTRAT
ncbi:MAG: hypothetical protein PGN13_11910 [Patulibacter minatonensis]